MEHVHNQIVVLDNIEDILVRRGYNHLLNNPVLQYRHK